MKAFKLLIVMLLVGWQASATGFSHNMLVAQKMLNAKEKCVCIQNQTQTLHLQLTAKSTVVKPATRPVTESTEEETVLKPEISAVSLSQHIARWVVRIVTVTGQVLTESLVSLFSSGVKNTVPVDAIFVSVTDNVLSYLLAPARTMP